MIHQRKFWCCIRVMSILYLLTPALSVYGEVEEGKTIFFEHCMECHGIKGDGRGPIAPYLEETPANLLAQKTQTEPDEALFEIIKYGAHLEMPSWEGILSDQEIWKVVKYLRNLNPPSLPADE